LDRLTGRDILVDAIRGIQSGEGIRVFVKVGVQPRLEQRGTATDDAAGVPGCAVALLPRVITSTAANTETAVR